MFVAPVFAAFIGTASMHGFRIGFAEFFHGRFA
jgi:hypothetical protein